MTKQDLHAKIQTVLERCNLDEKIESILNHVDVDNLPQNDVRTAKNVLIAVLQHSADQIDALGSRKNWNQVNEFKQMIKL